MEAYRRPRGQLKAYERPLEAYGLLEANRSSCRPIGRRTSGGLRGQLMDHTKALEVFWVC